MALVLEPEFWVRLFGAGGSPMFNVHVVR